MVLVASLAFGFYTAHFDAYNATYGSLGAAVILMLWLYVAGFVLLVGAEVNAVVEQYAGEPAGDRVHAPHARPDHRRIESS